MPLEDEVLDGVASFVRSMPAQDLGWALRPSPVPI